MTTTNTARAAYIPTSRHARTRAGNAMSPARRNAFLDSFVARCNGTLRTAAAYLTDVLGADTDFIRRYASQLGKHTAKAHRARVGQDPARNGLARVGTRLVRVFTYDTADLAAGSRSYARTAELLAA